MGHADKTLEKMRSNPADWTIESIEAVAAARGVAVRRGSGSHVVFSAPQVRTVLTVPARPKVKPVYVRLFVGFMDEVSVPSEAAGRP